MKNEEYVSATPEIDVDRYINAVKELFLASGTLPPDDLLGRMMTVWFTDDVLQKTLAAYRPKLNEMLNEIGNHMKILFRGANPKEDIMRKVALGLITEHKRDRRPLKDAAYEEYKKIYGKELERTGKRAFSEILGSPQQGAGREDRPADKD